MVWRVCSGLCVCEWWDVKWVCDECAGCSVLSMRVVGCVVCIV